jgi:hypothetical protein
LALFKRLSGGRAVAPKRTSLLYPAFTEPVAKPAPLSSVQEQDIA